MFKKYKEKTKHLLQVEPEPQASPYVVVLAYDYIALFPTTPLKVL